MKNSVAARVARALLEIDAVGFTPESPITFKSGIISPMYIDNRKLPSFPTAWRIVLDAFIDTIEERGIDFDVLAGIETAGIPHSAALGVLLKKPSVFIRKAAKDHGTKKMVEGGDVRERRALLIEDLVTTGGSSLHGVQQLRAANATATDCLVIVSYGFPDAAAAFESANVRLSALTTLDAILTEAVANGLLTEHHRTTVQDWQRDPWNWGR